MNTITIENRGERIVATNYWRSDYNRHGVILLSINARCIRVLIPSGWESEILRETFAAKQVIVSRGPWKARNESEQDVAANRTGMIEILFDDGSVSPFAIHVGEDQCLPVPSLDQHGQAISVALWISRRGKPHCARVYPGVFRVSESILDMRSDL